jgi:DNA-binding transcriptional ArsR family regulator
LGRENIIEHLLILSFTRRVDDQSGGATFERLAALAETTERVGARAVRTALRLLKIGGLVVATRSRRDGRLRIYQPTPTLLAQARDYYAIVLGVFDALVPGASVRSRLKEDPAYLAEILGRAGEAFLAQDFTPRPGSEAFAQLLRLDGARAILAFVVDSHWSGRRLLTPGQLAPLFQVSGSQTRLILKAAADKALIVLGPRGALMDASALAAEYLLNYSQYLAFFARFGFDLEDRLAKPSS